MPTIPSALNALGDSNDIELSPQGLLDFVELRCDATVTITLGSGNTLRLGARAPYNTLGNIFLYDPDNWPCIVNVDGYELYADDMTKWKRYPHDPSYPYGPTYDYSGGVSEFPISAGANTWRFSLILPACVNSDIGDLRGMLNLASANARARIQYIVNSSLLGTTDDSVLVVTGGTPAAVLTSLTVTPVMHFFQPVMVTDAQSGEVWKPTPVAELETIHELTSSRYAGAVNPGADSPVVFVTGREYLRVIEQLVIAGAQVFGTLGGAGASGATRVKFLVNDTTPITDYALREYVTKTRREYGRDFNFFVWPLDYRVWDSDQYGDLVTSLTLASGLSTSGSYIQQYRKCVYRAGSVEPLSSGVA
jgi:hypothetical protein